ncbi:hypothetical protein CEUSTIGMA_g6843.t1 [Chlamydomonas eustigma]|uniref:RmlD-like substrate binding domain-containing protein n=1 Tax=Chlamydomonas eustigma TaxID=1157962 RepID=A0A250X932_9CHLO|nr:hypothetical protein CEUSTIGMA_g6843.t1 [Chlamydomonas eustigma]|eukprot:GAX79402.1 hypothetical protein CEUSTIGMA_g6843.t1 [Chlamydomonas eustigma]
MHILITGGSGYLGQFLIKGAIAAGHQVTYTYSSVKLDEDVMRVEGGGKLMPWKVDFSDGSGLDDWESRGPFAVVVNCAALSQPGVCEQRQGFARAINVPTRLLDCLHQQHKSNGNEALLIQISTDQVYDGSRADWQEDDLCEPVNTYGRTKLEAEAVIKARWQKHVILRSSIIYGPLPPHPVARTLFLQFVEKVLQEGSPTTFFNDEFRCPIFVDDIVKIVMKLSSLCELPERRVFNMGGPQRLSRADMAVQVAKSRGLSTDTIVCAPSSSVQRTVASPPDISMMVKRIKTDLGVQLTHFSEALQYIPFNCGPIQ